MEKEETKQDIIQDTLQKEIVSRILPDIKEQVMQEVNTMTKNIRKRIKTIQVKKADGTTTKQTDIVHEKFEEILTLVNNNIPVMLTGGAGSGKSSTCEKVAQALRLRLLF